jgi:hypothetical protein
MLKVGDRCIYNGTRWRGLAVPLGVVQEVGPRFTMVKFDNGRIWAVRTGQLRPSVLPPTKNTIRCRHCGNIIIIVKKLHRTAGREEE